MNNKTFRETIACFTRTELLIAEFGESFSTETAVKLSDFRLPEAPDFNVSMATLPAKLESLRLLNALARTSMLVGRRQCCWNRKACEIVEGLSKELGELLRVAGTQQSVGGEAKTRLGEVRKIAKRSKSLPWRRQVRFNGAFLEMLDMLIDAHQVIENAWCEIADIEPNGLRWGAPIKEAKRIHERSNRGLRRYLGPFSAKQARFNEAVTEFLSGFHDRQLEIFQCRRRNPGKGVDPSQFKRSRLGLHGWVHASGVLLDALLAETKKLNKQVGELQSQNRSQDIALKTLMVSLENYERVTSNS